MTQLSLALDRVQERSMNWYSDCFDFALDNFSRLPKQFTSEDLIQLYRDANLPEPLETRVWGAVMVKLKRGRLIKPIGFSKYKNPNGHCKPSTIWEKV